MVAPHDSPSASHKRSQLRGSRFRAVPWPCRRFLETARHHEPWAPTRTFQLFLTSFHLSLHSCTGVALFHKAGKHHRVSATTHVVRTTGSGPGSGQLSPCHPRLLLPSTRLLLLVPTSRAVRPVKAQRQASPTRLQQSGTRTTSPERQPQQSGTSTTSPERQPHRRGSHACQRWSTKQKKK